MTRRRRTVLLGALAVIQGEQPSLDRAVAFANPANWDPSDEFVAALIAGLRANPFVRPVTVDTLLAETPLARVDDEPDNDPIIRTLAPTPVTRPPVKAARYYEGLLDRNALAALFSRRIEWRGITYELKSPHETVIIERKKVKGKSKK